jgi:hypothetical protein
MDDFRGILIIRRAGHADLTYDHWPMQIPTNCLTAWIITAPSSMTLVFGRPFIYGFRGDLADAETRQAFDDWGRRVFRWLSDHTGPLLEQL